jgi:hypothetical protein
MWWDVVKIFDDPKPMLFPPDVVLLLEQGRSFYLRYNEKI